MITTRFMVEYYVNVIPLSMKVDAVCAKDAVETVLAAYPNAAIVAVTDTDRTVGERPGVHATVRGAEDASQRGVACDAGAVEG